MIEKLTYEEFIYNLELFLKEENAYDEFVNNLTKNNKNLTNLYLPYDFKNFISRAFIWSTTKEGIEYWIKLDSKLKLYKTKRPNYDNYWDD